MTFIKFKNDNHGHRAVDPGIFFPKVFSETVENLFGNDFITRQHSAPAANISENKDHFMIDLRVPGFAKEDVKIALENETLTISSEHKEEKKNENSNYSRREFSVNSFSRSFTLPEEVDKENIQASVEHGVLRITLPKKETAKQNVSKEIKIS